MFTSQICAKTYSNLIKVIKGVEAKEGGAKKINSKTVNSSRVMPLNKG